MKIVTVQDYLDEFQIQSIYDLDLLESEGEFSRLALPDGENSIWVCDECGELADPDEVCEFCNNGKPEPEEE